MPSIQATAFFRKTPEACAKNDIVFIGPKASTMRAVGSKQSAKVALAGTKVPLIPGFNPPNPSDQALTEAAEELGFPLVIKASHGGGGKGLKIVHKAQDFKLALAAARREAKAYFNHDELLLEKLIVAPRHLEVQILGDHHGNLLHLFERDCSVQRRQQKIIEEAPAIHLSPQLRTQLYAHALAVGHQFAYTNAGTVEFLLTQDEKLYFMEVNARLQVEHPITELITGIDLVEWQIRIAHGEMLHLAQPEHPHGHAIECRICAEIPEQDFRPSQGQISAIHWPSCISDTRIDTGIEPLQIIGAHYDSLLAKAMVWAPTREQAIPVIQDLMRNSEIFGLETNLGYLSSILQHSEWIQGGVAIDFLSKTAFDAKTIPILAILACLDSIQYWQQNSPLPQSLVDFSLLGPRYNLRDLGEHRLWIHYCQPGEVAYRLEPETPAVIIHYQSIDNHLYFDDGDCHHHYRVEELPGGFRVHHAQQVFHLQLKSSAITTTNQAKSKSNISSPMPATIVAILKNKGDTIQEGEPLVVLEAMKMEHTIYAPYNGILKEFYYQLGQQVQEGQELLLLDATNG